MIVIENRPVCIGEGRGVKIGVRNARAGGYSECLRWNLFMGNGITALRGERFHNGLCG